MGITGAPFGPIGMKICPTTPPSRAFARGKGFRVPGGWGVGKKLENVSFWGHFLKLFTISTKKIKKKLTKSVKFARIGLILIQDESPHRVLDSPGGFGQFFQKIGRKRKFVFSGGKKNV